MTDSEGYEPIPSWSYDTWSSVIGLSQADAHAHYKAYEAVHGKKSKEHATLYIFTNNDIVVIEVNMDPIGVNYHIDTRFVDKSSGRLAMRGIITEMKNASKMVADSKQGFQIHHNPVKVPAYLELSDGSLSACAVQLYPHNSATSAFAQSGGHFDASLIDSSQGGKDVSPLVENMRKTAKMALIIARFQVLIKAIDSRFSLGR